MQLILADDSQQSKPTRRRMGPLVGIGGVHVERSAADSLERELNRLCRVAGFPDGEEFKWSPRKHSWMWTCLHNPERDTFFCAALTAAALHGVRATVVVSDVGCRYAIKTSPSHEQDVTDMFLERSNWALAAANTTGIVILDRPGGNQITAARYFAACFRTVTTGTPYVLPKRILRVEATTGYYSRLHQLADLVTGCTVARVAGSPYSKVVFALIKPLLRTDGLRIGGVGLKIHPDLKYANLYHRLVGDRTWWKGTMGIDLPCPGRLYYSDDGEPPDLSQTA